MIYYRKQTDREVWLLLLTRETDYALRILRSLNDGALHSARELAERELLPLQFTYKILKKLAKAGFLAVERGAEGGSRLIVDLNTRTLYDLVLAVDGNKDLIACMDPAYRCSWRQAHGACTVHCQLSSIQRKLEKELNAHPLSSFFPETT